MAANGKANGNGTKAGIIGLGYVGLPLAMEFARAGVTVVGVDIDKRRTASLKAGHSYIEDVPSELVRTFVDSGKFIPTTEYAELADVDAVSICVPTPLGKSKDPDMGPVASSSESLAKVLRRGQTVILESTVYPGATEEFVKPILEKSGLRAGIDFFLAFSPERIDPGNKKFAVPDIPKVVGGMDAESTRRASEHYAKIFKKVVQVGSTREAEMAKLLENTFRAVNIGLINELAIVAHSMGIDIWRVIEAASSKPFGYMPFYPGPGWGGHCIPVDPFYLTWRARVDGYEVGFIDQAGRINNRMPHYVVDRTTGLLNDVGKPMKGSKVLVLGTAYKRDVSDVRESPALEVIKLLDQHGAQVSFHDPHVRSLEVEGKTWQSSSLTAEMLQKQDCVVIVTDHSTVDYEFVANNSKVVFDTRNATKSLRAKYKNITVL
jgi:UDP-N-acetyl-D-glucosamine dehydrogenase